MSKIQDFGLTDYEVRDLNDEINKLIREKGAWEHQIVSLGGANYRRGVPKMLDDNGREVPGTRGYKYFGRAKDLPGVKELLNRTAEQEAEIESFRSQKFKRFANQSAEYYGDLDEDDGELLATEMAAEMQAWRQGYAELLEELGEEVDGDKIPPIPRPDPQSLSNMREQAARQTGNTMEVDGEATVQAAGDASRVSAMFHVLDPEQLSMPAVPDRAKMEAFILQARKRALKEQCECLMLFSSLLSILTEPCISHRSRMNGNLHCTDILKAHIHCTNSKDIVLLRCGLYQSVACRAASLSSRLSRLRVSTFPHGLLLFAALIGGKGWSEESTARLEDVQGALADDGLDRQLVAHLSS